MRCVRGCLEWREGIKSSSASPLRVTPSNGGYDWKKIEEAFALRFAVYTGTVNSTLPARQGSDAIITLALLAMS